MKIKMILTLMLFTINMVAQVDAQKDNLNNPKEATVESTNYFNEIRINSHWAFKQEKQIRVGGEFAVFEFPLLLKYHITKNTSFLIGPKLDFYTNTMGIESPPSVYGTMGIQYDVFEGVLIEAKFNYLLTDDMPINTDYSFGSKNSFTLGSKFRF
ncbi:hypothetical protein QLS71_017735 [Mariniflexile litorale]|uniref:Outer membrane protein beta-barrel domain-containing protein n=1 Tax=Mariniflexile litorale TaxID=3045158 RepID=A0AAU7EFC9_9FLAO|nr:hypothetical protein [Mariniflexile sp. KMM 9835]MDQ8213110.1 hypothetical protein [Mariniflexile sp. KMM 9835]